jgi:hypothetical protein
MCSPLQGRTVIVVLGFEGWGRVIVVGRKPSDLWGGGRLRGVRGFKGVKGVRGAIGGYCGVRRGVWGFWVNDACVGFYGCIVVSCISYTRRCRGVGMG